MIHDDKRLTVQGIETRYLDTGGGNPALVLLHGGMFGGDGFAPSARAWELNLAALSPHFRVLALDTLGHGGTAAPATATDYTCDAMVAHVLAFLDALDIPHAHLVGHDHGGLVAATLAMREPARVRSCTLVNGMAVAPAGDGVPNHTLQGMPAPAHAPHSLQWVLRRQSVDPHHVGAGRYLQEASEIAASARFQAMRAQAQRPDVSLQITRSALGAKVRLFAHLRQHGLAAPTLILWGAQDPMSSFPQVTSWGAGRDSNSPIAHARALFNLVQARQPMTRLALMNRCGYLPFREQPKVFNDVVGGFVRAVDATH